MFPAREAHGIARMGWAAATVSAAAAALFYRGTPLWPDLHDAVLEIGLASIALLLIPRNSRQDPPSTANAHSTLVILLALVVFAVFAATLGRGVSS
jgi:hypothetical protein